MSACLCYIDLLLKPCAGEASCIRARGMRVEWVQRPFFSQPLPDEQDSVVLGSCLLLNQDQ